jgi:Zn-dependent peptidase ImmA (M78 family)
MTGGSFIVPARSWDSIEARTVEWRKALRLENLAKFPIMEVLEKILDNKLDMLRLEVGSMSEMQGAEGHTDPNGEFIELRIDVYEKAWAGDARARFTAAHEFGHYDMHTGVKLSRAPSNVTYKPFVLSEPQANHFASCLLVPAHFISRRDNPQSIMERHGVSFDVARFRLDYLLKKGRIAA